MKAQSGDAWSSFIDSWKGSQTPHNEESREGGRERGGVERKNERDHLCLCPGELLTYFEFLMSDNTQKNNMFMCINSVSLLWEFRRSEKETQH